MIRARYVLFALIALCSYCWLACTQERQPCLTPKTATLNIQSIHFPTDTAKTPNDTLLPVAVFEALTIDTVKGYVYPARSSGFAISLSPDSTVCQWLFRTDTLVLQPDTLTFFYRRKLQFLSNACGYACFYELDSVSTTHTLIDSAHIINSSVTNDVKPKHVQIYIHPNF